MQGKRRSPTVKGFRSFPFHLGVSLSCKEGCRITERSDTRTDTKAWMIFCESSLIDQVGGNNLFERAREWSNYRPGPVRMDSEFSTMGPLRPAWGKRFIERACGVEQVHLQVMKGNEMQWLKPCPRTFRFWNCCGSRSQTPREAAPNCRISPSVLRTRSYCVCIGWPFASFYGC